MRNIRTSLETGDIICIPVDDVTNVYAQFIVGDMYMGFYVLYDLVSEQTPLLSEITQQKKLFEFFTQGNLIKQGLWKKSGNVSVPIDIRVPEFKVELYDAENQVCRWAVMDYKGDILRMASKAEEKNLKTMHSYTPSLINKAIKAKYGISKWEPIYDGLLYRDSGQW